MLCADFENRLSDYLDGLLEAETHRLFAEHTLRCPVCHETLSQVKSAMEACQAAYVPPPSAELEARILLRTMPETAMTCEEFEQFLTDYLDGFLPAPLFHRWERHAALCQQCTELPGEVVRSIGACYTYKSEECPVPAGLNEKILQATLGTAVPEEARAPLTARLAERLRLWLDPIVSPQLATVATMLLMAVLVLTSTVSADGSISGMYSESLRLAAQSGVNGSGVNGSGISKGFKEFFAGDQNQSSSQTQPVTGPSEKSSQDKPAGQKRDEGVPNQEKTSKPKRQGRR